MYCRKLNRWIIIGIAIVKSANKNVGNKNFISDYQDYFCHRFTDFGKIKIEKSVNQWQPFLLIYGNLFKNCDFFFSCRFYISPEHSASVEFHCNISICINCNNTASTAKFAQFFNFFTASFRHTHVFVFH